MSRIQIIDFTLRGSVGGATLPEASDFIDLGHLSIGALAVPSDWLGGVVSLRFDIGDGKAGGYEFESMDLGSLENSIRTFSRAETTAMIPVNRFAILPAAPEGSDRDFKLIAMPTALD